VCVAYGRVVGSRLRFFFRRLIWRKFFSRPESLGLGRLAWRSKTSAFKATIIPLNAICGLSKLYNIYYKMTMNCTTYGLVLSELKSVHNSNDFIYWRNLTAAWLSPVDSFLFRFLKISCCFHLVMF